MDEDRRWHLDKKVPVALLIAIAGQTMGALWWAATTSARLETLERQVASSAPQAERLVRVEEKLGAVQGALGEIKGRLDAALTPPRR